MDSLQPSANGQWSGMPSGVSWGVPSEVWETACQIMPGLPVLDATALVYFLREFAVHPSYQGRGHGRRLHDAILRTRSESLAYLLVRPENPAEATYRHWGWHIVGEARPFPTMPAWPLLADDSRDHPTQGTPPVP